jgi:uncharacterized membrane protein (DUF2068 family)
MARSSSKRDHWLLLIGAAKCLKGVILFVIAVGALKLLHEDTANAVNRWIAVIQVDPHNHYLNSLVQKVGVLRQQKGWLLPAGTFVYAVLFLTEGLGLLFQQHWAEYFTVLVTGSFLPLEVYELIKHFSPVKVAIIIINAAIVFYLVWRLKGQHGHGAK